MPDDREFEGNYCVSKSERGCPYSNRCPYFNWGAERMCEKYRSRAGIMGVRLRLIKQEGSALYYRVLRCAACRKEK